MNAIPATVTSVVKDENEERADQQAGKATPPKIRPAGGLPAVVYSETTPAAAFNLLEAPSM